MKLILLALALIPTFASAQYPVAYLEKYQLERRVNLSQGESAEWIKDSQGPYNHFLIKKKYFALTAFGIGPMSDTYISSSRVHRDQKAQALTLPMNQDQFSDWNKGDALFYKRDKGVVIFPLGPIFIGPLARITIASSVHVYLEKKSDNILYAEIRPGKLTSQSIMGVLPLTYIERTRLLENYQNGVAYHFDLSTPTGEEAFLKLLDGKIAEVDEVVSTNTNDENQKIADTTYYRLSNFAQFGAATPIFPILSITRRNMTQRTVTTREDIWDQTEYNEEIASSSGRYDRSFRYVRNEYHELAISTKTEGEFDHLDWSWNYETNLGNSKRAKRALKRLNKLIPCKDSCDYKLPGKKTSNAYFKSSYELKIPFPTLKLALENNSQLPAKVKTAFLELVNTPNTETLNSAFKLVRKDKKILSKIFKDQCLNTRFEVAGEEIKRWVKNQKFCF